MKSHKRYRIKENPGHGRGLILIDPSLSAMENVWLMAQKAALNIIRRRNVKLQSDEIYDLMNELSLCAVRTFLGKVRSGRYDRKYSFFSNIWICAYSWQNLIINRFLERVRQKIESIDRLKMGNAWHDIINTPMPRYLGDGEKTIAYNNLKAWRRQSQSGVAVKFREKEWEDELYEARLETFGENYKPTDWTARREKRRSLKEEAKDENCDRDSGGEEAGKLDAKHALH